jgi:hypothetical protein
MTDKTDSKERDAFEAHWLREGNPRNSLAKWQDADNVPPKMRGAYVMACTRDAWSAFQAGRASLAANAGSEPVARADSWTNDQWIDLAVRHANADWNSDTPDGYLNAVKALCNDFAESHPSPPEGMVGGWIASKDQMPSPGVRVFWGDVDSNRVGYDSWAGDDYRWAPSHWMHIPEFPAPPTTSAGSKGE